MYSGYLRTWNQCHENQKTTLLTEDSDLYFYTYSKPDSTVFKQFIQIPCDYYTVMPDHKFNSNRRPESEPHNSFNQWHNNFIGFSLVPNNYDLYVRCRTDISFNDKVSFESYLYDDNTIYIPQGNDYWGINDQCAFGNYQAIKKYFNVYINKDDIFAKGVTYNPEVYLLENLKMQNMNVVRTPQMHEIVRL